MVDKYSLRVQALGEYVAKRAKTVEDMLADSTPLGEIENYIGETTKRAVTELVVIRRLKEGNK